MQIPLQPGIHLTYCSNVHPGESWNETFHQLKQNLPELKRRLSPDRPFGIGLRLSAIAAEELLLQQGLSEFRVWLKEQNLYVFTMNGFPYGSFHGEQVKDAVYKPDWRTEERFNYTSNLIDLMANLLPEGMEGSISTSPVSYKYWDKGQAFEHETFNISSLQFAKLAAKMAGIFERTGKEIHLAIEPEPDCLIENSRETIHFFQQYLLPEGSKFLADQFDYSMEKAESVLKRHIGICYDTCHFALEFEKPSDAISALQNAGIRISKTQISAALKAIPGKTAAERSNTEEKLRPFVEPVYLHQVIECMPDGSLNQFRDLPDALRQMYQTEAEEWRIHFHVPVFFREFDGLMSTQDDIKESLALLFDPAICSHFEIETYTWDVMPEHLKTTITGSIEREYLWTLDTMKQLTDQQPTHE